MSPSREDDGKLIASRNGILKLYKIAEGIVGENDLTAAHPEKAAVLRIRPGE